MTSVTIDEIKRQQKEDIFCSEQREECQMVNIAGGQQARVKALQQLAVSEDSPFNLTSSADNRPTTGQQQQQLKHHHQQQQQQQVFLSDERQQQQLREVKARQLREETEEIKRQLELVKSHLNELNLFNGCSRNVKSCGDSQTTVPHDHVGAECRRVLTDAHACDATSSQGTQNTRQDRCNQANNIISHGQPVSGEWSTVARNTRRPPIEDFANDQQITSADSQFNRNTIANPPASGQHDTCGGGQQQQHQTAPKIFYDGDGAKRVSDTSSTRFRPLTGKTDCPNCACDRRRSVCDKCIRLQKDVVHQESDQQQEEQEQQQQQLQARQPTLLTEQRINNSGLNESNGALLTMAAKQQQQQQNKPSAHFRDYDERPIRPATKKLDDLLNEASSHKPIVMMKGRGAAPNASSGTTNEQVIVDQTVVPNKLYTIGKSLDDKRTKLAQAIEDLQIMMDKVKKRGDRLEQERKVAMLYRDQWKYGPTIGGGGLGGTSKSGSRESLRGSVGGQYQSRLDPNLARDSKSMMGFKHIEPELKLRQYNTSRAPALPSARGRQQFQQARAPKPKPRLSKMGTSSSNNKTSQVAFGSGNYQRSTQASVLHSRSKSLESLPRQRSTLTNGIRQQQHRPPPTNQTRTTVENLAKTNFHNGKSSSELDLSSPSKPSEEEESTPDHGVEEDLEEEIREDDMENGGPAHDEMRTNGAGNSLELPGEENRAIHKDPSDSQADRPASNETRSRSGSRSPRSDDGQERSRSPTNDEPEPGRRLSGWVPVFGETEIKTISKRPAERKVIILNGLAGGRTRDTTTTTGNAIANFRRPSEPIPSSSVGVGRSILRTGANMTMARPTTARASSLSGARGEDRVLNEAKKKLQFANNLLESEHLDSRTKNQVIVNRQQRARTTTTNQAQALRSKPTRDEAIAQQVLVRANNYSSKQMMIEQGSDQQRQPTKRRTRASSTSSADWQEENAQSLGDTSAAATTTNDTARSLIFSANKEISRLETMISEQQRLLLKLTSHDNQAMVTSCCQHHHHSVSRQPTEQPSASTSSQPTSSGGGVGRSHPTTGRQLISLLRDRLNKTKARLAKTLEEERAKHQQLDSSLRKQSDLENENELLKQSLSKCIDTCLRDISSTFESLSDHLSESASGIEAAAGGSGGSDLEVAFGGPTVQTAASPTPSGGTPLLANAAQLIADNSHLRRMRSHIDTIERQRRGIFEELNQEKHRSQQLELELKQSKLELEQLVEAKRHLEAQLAGTAQQANYSTSSEQVPSGGQGNTAGSVSQMNIAMKAKQDEPSSSSECHHQHQSESSARSTTTTPAAAPPIPSPTFRQQTTSARLDKPGPSSEQPLSDTDDPTTTTTSNSMTFSSIDLYRQYIQSMTPDLDAIRRERRMILDEFDNIKRMLSDMDT